MNVYIKAQESVCLVHPEIKIKDIMSLYCTDKDLEQKIKNQSVYHFIGDHDQRKCFSVLMLVEVIKQVDKTLDVINLGAEDFIVYYKRKQEESKIFHYGKIVFVILVAFFGANPQGFRISLLLSIISACPQNGHTVTSSVPNQSHSRHT